MRYAIDLSYLGTNYHGWQSQPNAISVQETIENALSTILRNKIEIVGSGRTDAGVHASKQVLHFDFEETVSEELISKVNRFLPYDISLNYFAIVQEDFHARFDPTSRAYNYYIHQNKNPFLNGQSFYFRQEIDLEKMNEACAYLLGKQDFESFSKVKTDVSTFFCEIFEAKFIQEDSQIVFYVKANRFLRGMVRALVGTLLEVGLGNQNPEWIKNVIESKNRNAAGRNVAPEGLFLCEVNYDKQIDWKKIL
jgi:tRNA pseudouridine38-40 synthase